MSDRDFLTQEQRDAISELIGDAKPASSALLVSFAQSVRDRRDHDHPKWEDFYCLNLSAYMGERAAYVLRRVVDAEARIAELEAAQGTVYRASHESIVMGLYATAAEARKHCETELRREYDESTKVSLWWREGEDTGDQPEDGEQELFVHATPSGMERGRTWRTGYVVKPLEVASEYDPDGDE
ncbi:hypothetical protein ACF09J_13980 [Streptomyces sp. NPDC014889]|uniref:hypothetical protein n=1 Tax=Streptomyces sp. NPDC014889 TaxID=3364928 RepID=UPI0036FED242